MLQDCLPDIFYWHFSVLFHPTLLNQIQKIKIYFCLIFTKFGFILDVNRIIYFFQEIRKFILLVSFQCLLILNEKNFISSLIRYYNAGYRPSMFLIQRQEIVHRVYYLFAVENKISNIYLKYWKDGLKYLFGMHLLYRHLYVLGRRAKRFPKVFDEYNTMKYNNTLKYLALSSYNPSNITFNL